MSGRRWSTSWGPCAKRACVPRHPRSPENGRPGEIGSADSGARAIFRHAHVAAEDDLEDQRRHHRREVRQAGPGPLHRLGAAGAVEGVFSVLTLQHGIIPPTINYENPDPECNLDYVPNQARRADVQVVLSNSFGFGGTNACVIFRRGE